MTRVPSVSARLARRLRPYVPDAIAVALSVLGGHFIEIAGIAFGSALGPVFRAGIVERDRRESADVVEETIATVGMAGSDVMDSFVPTGHRDAYGNYPVIEFQTFAQALRAGTDTAD